MNYLNLDRVDSHGRAVHLHYPGWFLLLAQDLNLSKEYWPYYFKEDLCRNLFLISITDRLKNYNQDVKIVNKLLKDRLSAKDDLHLSCISSKLEGAVCAASVNAKESFEKSNRRGSFDFYNSSLAAEAANNEYAYLYSSRIAQRASMSAYTAHVWIGNPQNINSPEFIERGCWYKRREKELQLSDLKTAISLSDCSYYPTQLSGSNSNLLAN
jgi:hypothetical protein